MTAPAVRIEACREPIGLGPTWPLARGGPAQRHRKVSVMFRFLASTVGIIFVIGLLVVIGLLALIF